MTELLSWDIYEITTEKTSINGVMLRGRIRKLWLEKGINVLAENTQDIEASVRFAILHWEDATLVIDYLRSTIKDATVKLVLEWVKNPVLSKLKINKEERYTL
jgi:hypothetical protein